MQALGAGAAARAGQSRVRQALPHLRRRPLPWPRLRVHPVPALLPPLCVCDAEGCADAARGAIRVRDDLVVLFSGEASGKYHPLVLEVRARLYLRVSVHV